MSRPVILYHGGGCHDGFTAAWVVWRALGNDVKFVPCRYGEPVYIPEGDDGDIYLIDFSYKKIGMDVLSGAQKARGNRLIVLDHHKTALEELGEWIGEEITKETRTLFYGTSFHPVEITFDLDECGSTLAWEHFFTGEPRPRLLEYVKDRDLWLRDLPHNEEVRSYMESIPMDFNTWDVLERNLSSPYGFRDAVEKGKAILSYKLRQIEDSVSHAVPVTLSGRRGWAVNSTVQFSEIAGRLAEKEGSTFGCAYFRRDDGKWQYSLRARGGWEVDGLASERGGGGHPKAAGFESEELIF